MNELEVAPTSPAEIAPEAVVAVVPTKKSASSRAAPEAVAVVMPEPVLTEATAVEPTPEPSKPALISIHLPDAAALKDGAEAALKDGAEKVRLTVSKAQDYSKQNLAAVVASFEAANKGATTLRSQSLSLSKSLFETGVSSAKSLAAAKSLHDVTDIYRDFAKFALDTHLTGVETLAETVSSSLKDAFTPLKARVQETLRFGQKAAA